MNLPLFRSNLISATGAFPFSLNAFSRDASDSNLTRILPASERPLRDAWPLADVFLWILGPLGSDFERDLP